jgi:bacteriochlorophyll 4-vinyl reductase
MRDAGIGRLLVASLHQAIADVLPMRLEFYENWLNPDGLRHGTIGLAPLAAVLSFLRAEGESYRLITSQAGAYAAEWILASQSPLARRLPSVLPFPLRVRAALQEGRQLVSQTYGGSRAIVRLRRGAGSIDLRGSLFCVVRERAPQPLCGFYEAAFTRVLELYGVDGSVRVEQCRAAGDPRCLLSVEVRGPGRGARTAGTGLGLQGSR